MRIGVDIRVLMDEYYSGVSQYAANLLEAILAQDVQNEYRLFYNSFKPAWERLQRFERANARLLGSRLPNKVFNYLGQKLISRPRLDCFLGGVDVFWSPHFNFSSLQQGTRSVVTVHDLSFLRYPSFFSWRQNLWHRLLNVKKILRRADTIVAVSESTKNDIIELVGVASEKIVVIYSGDNASGKRAAVNGDFRKQADNFLSLKGLSGRFILFVGTIEPRKNVSGLITAFDRLKQQPELADLKLVLAGGRGWRTKKIYDRWQESPYRDDIVFLGYVSATEQDYLYSRASAFAYPSFYEGFGLPPLEAMSWGLPVICSNVSSLPEVVGEAAVMINPFSPSEIAAALSEVLLDQSLAALLSKRGLERSCLFSWEKTARQYLEVLGTKR